MKIVAKRLLIWGAVILCLLMIPALAMRYTTEVRWDLSDFILMGTALSVLGILYEWVGRSSGNKYYKMGFGLGLLGLFLLFWVNAAVGIIGNEGQEANLLYNVVFIVAALGSLFSRFSALGMTRTMGVAALVQVLVPVAAYLLWPPPVISWSPGVSGVFLISAFFAVLYLVSAYLFRRAVIN
ncbi:hypothetical protein [Zeaxanthinibacter enoshimensis]|uniref:Uncharacterized protein n=1 Tax=Zeaxanthinibacter enoshimensis TaxID=392009 RepID=A0A4R6TLU1_9FLAO|nr:hypothetical protein [Zeaxanthinibacter enoshimensis]TDQ32354.1 hypothetical protein CLV82_0179 [Zeaxanthinibacter enoshimensis]